MDKLKSWFLIHLTIVSASAQYFDFFQDPYFKPYQINNQNYNFGNFYTTKKPVTYNNNGYNNYNSVKSTTKSSYAGEERDGNIDQTTKERGSRRKSTTNSIYGSNYYTSTVKPVRKTVKHNNFYTKDNNNNHGTDNPRNGNRKDRPVVENNFNPRETANNQENLYYPTEKPKAVYNNGFNNNQNDNNNYNSGNEPINSYTTHNPVYRPGVKPAVVNGPPITNRPATRWPSFETKRTTARPYYTTRRSNDRPTSKEPDDSIAFPGSTSVEPNFIAGVDEDKMSAADKRRYIELGERMCDKYKSLNTKPQAIPLLPSPEPAKVAESCDSTSVPLVVGGKIANIRDFPHMALLGWRKIENPGYSWKCGGSLISDQFVLTAAHCVYQERDNSVVIGPPTVVQLGSSFLDDPAALVVRILSIIKDPRYKLPSAYYDIALLKLRSKVKFSASIRPACLGSPPSPGDNIIATGWGQTQFGGEQSAELRSVRLPVWGGAACERALGSSRKLPRGVQRASQLCAAERAGGRDTCQGDSGGPAMVQDGCSWRVVAVTSLGRSCGAPDTPGLYATVQQAFIAAHVFGNVNSDKNSNRYGNSENNNEDDKNSNRNGIRYSDSDGNSQNHNEDDEKNSKSNRKESGRREDGVNYDNHDTTSKVNGYNNNNEDSDKNTDDHANVNGNRQYFGSNDNGSRGYSHHFGNVNNNDRGSNNVYNNNNNNDSINRYNGNNNNGGNEGSYSDNDGTSNSFSNNNYRGDSFGQRDSSSLYRTTTNNYNGNYYNGNGRIWQ